MRELDTAGDGLAPDWRSAFRDASRPACDPHADFEFFDPFGGVSAPPGRMEFMIRALDGQTGTIASALDLIAEAVELKGPEVLNVYYPGWFPDADFGVIAVAGRSARPWGIIKFRVSRRPVAPFSAIPLHPLDRTEGEKPPIAIPARATTHSVP